MHYIDSQTDGQLLLIQMAQHKQRLWTERRTDRRTDGHTDGLTAWARCRENDQLALAFSELYFCVFADECAHVYTYKCADGWFVLLPSFLCHV